jgi:hypothetical protein
LTMIGIRDGLDIKRSVWSRQQAVLSVEP